MGAFFLARREPADSRSGRAERMAAHFGRCGFVETGTAAAAGYELRVYRKRRVDHRNVWFGNSGQFAASTGTFLYRRSLGEEALRRFLADFADDAVAWDEVFGHYCLVLSFGGRLFLLTDRLGTYPVWRDPDWQAISSAFLAVASAQETLGIDAQCVYEYVFQGASYGEDSPFREVRRIDRGVCLELGETIEEIDAAPPLPRRPAGLDFESCVERNLANLRRYFAAIAACFGNKIDTALSGGYDSRLTLALLMERGLAPNVHVYGSERDGDVVVARTVAAAEGFVLHHADKSRAPPPPADQLPAIVERNFLAFDGFPPDGIFDNGSDLETRSERCATGELMLNGGGGEIYRNFFYLSGRPFSVRELLWTFYSQFDPAVCTEAFSERDYHARLGDKIRRAIGARTGRLARRQVEMVYPAFRCRFWMGKNNGVNNALGWALTPFIDANTVPDAVAVPLRYKNFGRLEAAMIRRINPRLAAYKSDYGHSFAGPPPLKRILKDLATLCRPPWLRRFAWRLRRRSRAGWPAVLGEAQIARVIDVSFPYLGRYFHVDRIMDAGQFNRLCTLEYLFENTRPAGG